MNNYLLEKALFYASKGLYVFPCREKYEGKYFSKKYNAEIEAKAKQPRMGNGLKDASVDEKKIISWWSRKGWEYSAIGVNCGMSKLFAIDIDMHENNGFEKYMNLGISDQGAYHTLTANGGLHIIYSDPNGIGKTHARDKIGVDTRGIGGYIIMPPSFVLSDSGEKKEYKLVEGEWKDFPTPVQQETIDKLNALFNLNNKNHKSGKNYPITKKDSVRAKKAVESLSYNYLEDYQLWVNVGMSLRDLKEDGFNIWREWTEKYFRDKPESKRIGTLEYKWKSFFENSNNSKIGLGSLFYWSKECGNG